MKESTNQGEKLKEPYTIVQANGMWSSLCGLSATAQINQEIDFQVPAKFQKLATINHWLIMHFQKPNIYTLA